MGTPTTTETENEKQFRLFLDHINQMRSNIDAAEALVKRFPLITSIPYELRVTWVSGPRHGARIYLPKSDPLKVNHIFPGLHAERIENNSNTMPHYGWADEYLIDGVYVIFVDDIDDVR